MKLLRAPLLASLLALCCAAAQGLTYAPTDDPEAIAIWLKVRASLFDKRPIAPAPADMLVLEVPARAIDAAVVPLAIRTRWPHTQARHVSRLYLFIDANPSPVAAIFQFTPASGRADIETRVRVDGYSFVRVVAEMNDGQLYTTARFVKASGGCSAPPGVDAAAAAAKLGQLRFRVDGHVQGSQPVPAQLVIEHPNHSGLAMDQLTRQVTPAHYVRKVDVRYRGQPVFSADVDFSISENPNFRFYFVPGSGGGELSATVLDSQDRSFAASQALRGLP